MTKGIEWTNFISNKMSINIESGHLMDPSVGDAVFNVTYTHGKYNDLY